MTGVVVPVEIESKDADKHLENINKNLLRLGSTSESISSKFAAIFRAPKTAATAVIKEQTEGVTDLRHAYNKTYTAASLAVTNTAETIKRLTTSMQSFIVAAGGIALIAGVSKISDDFTSLSNKLRLVADDSRGVIATQRELGKLALANRGTLKNSVDIYFAFGRALKEAGVGEKVLLATTSSVQKAIAISNTSAESASAALIQLSQGLASGALRGEEFNSVAEQIPALAAAIAKGVGVSIGQLRQMAAQGALAPEVILDALSQSSQYLEQEFAKTTASIGQGTAQAAESIKHLIAELVRVSEIAAPIYNGLHGIAVAVTDFSNAIEVNLKEASANINAYLYQVDRLAGIQDNLSGIKSVASFFGFSYLFDNLVTSVRLVRDAFDSIRMPDIFPNIGAAVEYVYNNFEKLADVASALGIIIYNSFRALKVIVPEVLGPTAAGMASVFIAFYAQLASVEIALGRWLRPVIDTMDAVADAATGYFLTNRSVERAIVGLFKSANLSEFTDGLYTISDAIDRLSRNPFAVTLIVWNDKLSRAIQYFTRLGSVVGLVDNQLITINNIRFDQVFRALATFKRIVVRVFTDIVMARYGDQILAVIEGIAYSIASFVDAFNDTFLDGKSAEAGAALGAWLIATMQKALYIFRANFPKSSIDIGALFSKAYKVVSFLGDLIPIFSLFITGLLGSLKLDKAMIYIFNRINILAKKHLGKDLGERIAAAMHEGIEYKLKLTQALVDGLQKVDYNGVIITALKAIEALTEGIAGTLVGYVSKLLTYSTVSDFAKVIVSYLTAAIDKVDFFTIGYVFGQVVRRAVVVFQGLVASIKAIDYHQLLIPDSGSLLESIYAVFKKLKTGIKKFIEGFQSGYHGDHMLINVFDYELVLPSIQESLKTISRLYLTFFGELFLAVVRVVSNMWNYIFNPSNFVENSTTSTTLSKVIDNAFGDSLGEGTEKIGGTFSKINTLIRTLISSIISSASKLMDHVSPIFKKFTNEIAKLFWELYDKVIGHSYWPDLMDGLVSHSSRLDTVKSKVMEFAKYVGEQFRKLANGEQIDLATPIINATKGIKDKLKGMAYETYMTLGTLLGELAIMMVRFEKGILVFALQQMFTYLLNNVEELKHGFSRALIDSLIEIGGRITHDLLKVISLLFKSIATFMPRLVDELLSQFGTIGVGLSKIFSQLPETLQHVLVLAFLAQMGFLGKSVKAAFYANITGPVLAAAVSLGLLMKTILSNLFIVSSGKTPSTKTNGNIWAHLFGALGGPQSIIAAVAATTIGIMANVNAMSAVLTAGVPLMLLAMYGKNSKGINRLIFDTMKGTVNLVQKFIGVTPKQRYNRPGMFDNLTRQLRLFRIQWKRYSAGKITIDELTKPFVDALKAAVKYLKIAFLFYWIPFSTWVSATWGKIKIRWNAINWFQGPDSVFGKLFDALKGAFLFFYNGFKKWAMILWNNLSKIFAIPWVAPGLLAALAVFGIFFASTAHAADITGNSLVDLGFSFAQMIISVMAGVAAIQVLVSTFKILYNAIRLKSFSQAALAELAVLQTRYGTFFKSIWSFVKGTYDVLKNVTIAFAKFFLAVFTAPFRNWESVKHALFTSVNDKDPKKATENLKKIKDATLDLSNKMRQVMADFWKSLKTAAPTGILDGIWKLISGLFTVKKMLISIGAIAVVGVGYAAIFGDTDDILTNIGRVVHSFLNLIGLVQAPVKIGIQAALEETLSKNKRVGNAIFDFTPAIANIDFSALNGREQKILVSEVRRNSAAMVEINKEFQNKGSLDDAQLTHLEKIVNKQRDLLLKLPQLGDSKDLDAVSKKLTASAEQSSVDIGKTISNFLRINTGIPATKEEYFEGLGAKMTKDLDAQLKKVNTAAKDKPATVGNWFSKRFGAQFRLPFEFISKKITAAFTPDKVNDKLLRMTAKSVEEANKWKFQLPEGSSNIVAANASQLNTMLERYRSNVKSTVPEQEKLRKEIDAQAVKVMDLADAYVVAAKRQKELTDESHAQIVEDQWLRNIVSSVDSFVNDKDSNRNIIGRGVVNGVNALGWKDFAKDYGLGLKDIFSTGTADSLYRLESFIETSRDKLRQFSLGSSEGVILRFRIAGLNEAQKEVAELGKTLAYVKGIADGINKVFTDLDEKKIEIIRKSDYELYKQIAKLTEDISKKQIELDKTPYTDKEQLARVDKELSALIAKKEELSKTRIAPLISEDTVKVTIDKLNSILPNADFKIDEAFLKVNPIVGIIINSVDKLKTSVSDLKLKGKFEEAELAANKLKDATINLKNVLDDFKFDSVHKVADNLGIPSELLAAAGPAAMAEAKRIAEDLNRAQAEFVKPNLSELQLDANARYLVELKKQKESFTKLDIFKYDSKDAGKEDAKSYTDAFAKTLKEAGLKGLEVAEYTNFNKAEQAQFRALIKESTKVNKILEAAPANAIPNAEVSRATISIGAYQKQLDNLVETSKLGQRTMNDMVSSFKDIFDGFSISDWFRIDPKVMKGLIEFENRMAALKVTMGQKPMSQMTNEEINNFMRSLEEADKKRRENAQQYASYPTKQTQSGLDEAKYARINSDYRDKIHELKSSSENLAAEMKGKSDEEARRMQLQILENNRKLDEVFVDAFSSMPFESTKMALKQAGVGYGEELAKATDQQLEVMKGIGLKIKAAAFIAANSDDQDTRIAAQMLAERLKGNLDSLVKEAQANLMLEAGRNFATSSIEGFSSGLTEVLSGKKSLKDFVTEQVDKFTSGVIDAFVKGLMAPLSGENGIISTWLKEQGENLFRLGASIFSKDGASIENLSKRSPDTILLGKIDITLNEILLAISSGNLGNNALSAATTLKMNGKSGIFGDFSNGLDDVFKGVTDDIDKFGEDIMDSFADIDFDGIGSSVGSLFKLGTSFFGSFFKDGGIAGYAGGGPVHGPGSGRSDSILARISRGEYIVNAARTAMYRPLLDAINYGNGLPAFANGGMYGQGALSTSVKQRDENMALSGKLEQVFYLNITGDVSRQTRREIQQMIPEIAHGVNIRNREENIK